MNVVDSAANYRRERGERSVGVALDRLFTKGTAQRDEVVVFTKGGFLPHGAAWFEKEFVGQGDITADDLVGGGHCMHPDYLDRSLENLGVETVDVHYVHNPESQAGKVPPEVFRRRLEAAFRMLEGAVQAGKIHAYGVATRNAFRVDAGNPGGMSLLATKNLARAASGAGGGTVGAQGDGQRRDPPGQAGHAARPCARGAGRRPCVRCAARVAVHPLGAGRRHGADRSRAAGACRRSAGALPSRADRAE